MPLVFIISNHLLEPHFRQWKTFCPGSTLAWAAQLQLSLSAVVLLVARFLTSVLEQPPASSTWSAFKPSQTKVRRGLTEWARPRQQISPIKARPTFHVKHSSVEMYELYIYSVRPVKTGARNVPIPVPKPTEILSKVIATSSNPKDWQFPDLLPGRRANEGDDIAGIVHAVGSEVIEFRGGDRVAGFHRMLEPYGSYAEYAITPETCTFRLPANISFEAGSTIPLTSITAAIALFQQLSLPLPWQMFRESQPKYGPLLIYGAGSTVGAWTLKLAGLVKTNKASGVGPIIAVAGTSSIDLVKSSGAADYIVDYKKSNVVTEVKKILEKEGKELRHAFDAISHTVTKTWENGAPCLAKEGTVWLNLTDVPEFQVNFEPNVVMSRVYCAGAYGEPDPDTHSYSPRTEAEAKLDGEFSYCMYRYIARMLKHGKLTPHPYEVQPKGLGSVEQGLQLLFDGKVSGKKLVYRVADTSGLEKFQ
ncbi:GroES-like protein [Tothia fuscella]|uniref:GroES-like protein n=1 Tax=Tothia fuscella TaxID=1048955 RepID=A0A9P4NID4_9PEZI|nr:GroES-like protein [Tothia fuscella]